MNFFQNDSWPVTLRESVPGGREPVSFPVFGGMYQSAQRRSSEPEPGLPAHPFFVISRVPVHKSAQGGPLGSSLPSRPHI